MKTLSNVVRVLVLVLSVGWQSYVLPVSAQTIIGEPVQLELKNEDLESLIQLVSRRSGKNFIVDPRVKAKVTMITAGPVAADKPTISFCRSLRCMGSPLYRLATLSK